ncbi:hypothetical protein B0H63DRAFT_125996 [Podospora didyma]|uniref:Uncharacterized protein n=1 Tax=Podospora didyma TaxID=330526 RepID=A0AAE0P078_9PEZI|nr:hypothetical protein B0H63DRAFT_125996 [Podospora didyma]
MAAYTLQSSRTEPRKHAKGSQQDVPRPLQILKRAEIGDRQATRRLFRRCSSNSTGTDVSMDSTLGPSGSDRPLTVPKRRVNHTSNQATGGSEGYAHPSAQVSMADLLRGEDQAGYMSDKHALPSSQGSLLCRSPNKTQIHPSGPPYSLSDEATNMTLEPRRVLSGVRDHNMDGRGLSPRRLSARPALSTTLSGYRQDHPRLRNAKSMFHIATASPHVLSGGCHSDGAAEVPVLHPAMAEESDLESIGSSQPADAIPGAFVLVPRIIVTPENKALDDGCATLWAAVQLSTELCRTSAPDYVRRNTDYGWKSSHAKGPPRLDAFRYGCLYDVSVQVLPTTNSTIIEVLDDRACVRSSLYPGSRLLIVAHVRLLSVAPPPRAARGHARQSSDDLIEDLEYHLGSTTTEYLQVRVTYRHSGFPQQQQGESRSLSSRPVADRVASVQTTIETTAIAVVKRHNSSSPWSPRPSPQPNPLFEIIASHWGAESASDIMHRILTSRSTPRKAATLRTTPSLTAPATSEERERGSEETVRPAPTRAAPPIPMRKTSLRQASFSSLLSAQESTTILRQPPLPKTSSSAIVVIDEKEQREEYSYSEDPARKIWTEMRRTSTGGRPSYLVSRLKRVPAASSTAMLHTTTSSAAAAPTSSSSRHAATALSTSSSARWSPLPATPTTASSNSRAARSITPSNTNHDMDWQQQREREQDRALRSRRSVGRDTLRRGRIMPTVAAAPVGVGGEQRNGGAAPRKRRLDNRISTTTLAASSRGDIPQQPPRAAANRMYHQPGRPGNKNGNGNGSNAVTTRRNTSSKGKNDVSGLASSGGGNGSSNNSSNIKEQQLGRWGWSNWWQ